MPDPRIKTLTNESSISDEVSKLEFYLQQRLEEDIARIFDESIYSDFEVVCGKSKILTHSCILKARTNQFFRKLEAILHVNIDRNTFDEIYSYISDAYTECNIKNQENEILAYLKSNVSPFKTSPIRSKRLEVVDPDVFATPKCTSPYPENKFDPISSLSPNSEVPKEYYALVPIDGYLLDKELNEQDELSDAFHTIIQTQDRDFKNQKYSKPSFLSLSSSHTSQKVKYSSSCDVINCFLDEANVSQGIKPIENKLNCNLSVQSLESISRSKFYSDSLHYSDSQIDKGFEAAYSPDSLIADDPSSSSDYLSAAHTFSPGPGTSGCFAALNVGENITKMENAFTSSDSGFENTGMIESINSNKDVTLADLSLTDTTLTYDTSSNCVNESTYLSLDSTDENSRSRNSCQRNVKELTCSKSSKEEKQRQNEEIVILESSSVSSETGSWESVFPPKTAEKDMCEKFIANERIYSNQENDRTIPKLQVKELETFIIQPPSCFINAASLIDEENSNTADLLLTAGQPDPSTVINKADISPCDISDSLDNDDSLEQTNDIETDCTHIDLSPLVFETLKPGKLSYNELNFKNKSHHNLKISSRDDNATPDNSMLSLKSSSLKNDESEVSETYAITNSKENIVNVRKSRLNEDCPLVSDGVSRDDSFNIEVRPRIRRKVDIPHVTNNFVEYFKTYNYKKSSKQYPGSTWIIDMSNNPKVEEKKACDRVCNSLKSEARSNNSTECLPKSRCSVDSDNSDKSTHKFFIDLSSLPDILPPEACVNNDTLGDKKNMFSMYIDLDKTTPKIRPRKLTSQVNKKQIGDGKSSSADKFSNKPNKKQFDTSMSDSITGKEMSFETYESLCDDLNLSINEIISNPESSNASTIQETSDAVLNEFEKHHHSDKKHAPIISEEVQSDVFVRLSDLDKPIQKSDISGLFENKKTSDDRMTRSIPENNWADTSHPGTSRSSEVITSFHSENALSLNRLFPHLKNEFSKSMPISLSGRNQFKSTLGTGETEDHISDVSELSSVQSSMLCSVIENSTTEDTSHSTNIISNSQSRLGQDLLRMFLEEIAPDVIVEVSGKRIKAHKCILSSRCQYFAGILSGGWVESAGNVIVLPPFSFNVVHFALCHIYSGLATIPDSISIVELATIADMLGLEGLKEAIMYTLKSKYCHHFHAPCHVCTAGVLECFPLSSVYGLDDLYRKCLRWITKYFSIVWPTKAFATLPKELLDKCYHEHLVNLKMDTVIGTIFGCGVTVASLQNSRWAESVAVMCRQLVNSVAHFIASNLAETFKIISTITSEASESARDALNDCLYAAIEWASPDETCRAYAFLSNVVIEIKTPHISPQDGTKGEVVKTLTLNNLLYKNASLWRVQCERALVRAAPRVVSTQGFKDLPADLRKRLQELGCIMYWPQAMPATPSPDRKGRSNKYSRQSLTKNKIDMEKVRNTFVPYKSKPVPVARSEDELKSTDLQIGKKCNRKQPPKIKSTRAQEERAKFNQCKKQAETIDKTVKTSNIYQNAKPRYFDQKVRNESGNRLPCKLNDLIPVSSSESSRNSSPIKCGKRLSRLTTKLFGEYKIDAMSQDSLATTSRPRTAEPSTDSLSESQTSNKYATYTKTKHIKGSIEQVNASKYLPPFKVLTKTKIPVSLRQKLASTNGNCKTIETLKPKKAFTELNSGLGVSKNYHSASNSSTLHESQKSLDSKPKTNYVNTKTVRSSSNDVKVPRSLMNATKSSSAKIVSKTPKKCQEKKTSKHPKQTLKAEKKETVVASQTRTRQNDLNQEEVQDNLVVQNNLEHLVDLEKQETDPHFKSGSVLERSSTFSKEGPTFAD